MQIGRGLTAEAHAGDAAHRAGESIASIPRRIDALARSLRGAGNDESAASSDAARPSHDAPVTSLAVFFLSRHRVLVGGEPVSGWPNCRGKSIFNYLVTHRARPTPKSVLMELFWSDLDRNSAKNNLNVAIYGLRKALATADPSASYVLFGDDCYILNPDLEIWVDAEAFMSHADRATKLERAGDLDAALRAYRAAEELYQNEYLAYDRYDEWLIEVRQKFAAVFAGVTARLIAHYFDRGSYDDCASMCLRLLTADLCNEEPHRRLMRCYSRLGQHHLALRQFHVCRDALARELGAAPSLETVRLFERLRKREPV